MRLFWYTLRLTGIIILLLSTFQLATAQKYNLAAGHSFNLAFGGEVSHEKFIIEAGELNPYTNGGRTVIIYSIKPYPGTSTGTKFNPVAPVSGAQVFPGKPLPRKKQPAAKV
jgi:hypothetical protein